MIGTLWPQSVPIRIKNAPYMGQQGRLAPFYFFGTTRPKRSWPESVELGPITGNWGAAILVWDHQIGTNLGCCVIQYIVEVSAERLHAGRAEGTWEGVLASTCVPHTAFTFLLVPACLFQPLCPRAGVCGSCAGC